MDPFDLDAVRRRGRQRVLLGLAILVAVILVTVLMAPLYYR